MTRTRYDAIVVGSGPNGLAAAITMARAGRSVAVFERADRPGGGLRSRALTLPGFVHDVCSAVHPLALSSPFFAGLPLARLGLEWIQPAVPVAHPLDGREAPVLRRSLEETARELGPDGRAYERLMKPLVVRWPALVGDVLAPLGVPRHPLLVARFGAAALAPATTLARLCFRTSAARALFAGVAAHALLPLDRPLTSAFALILSAAAHAVGWPIPRGGSQALADALVAHLLELGGEVVCGADVESIDALPAADVVLLDLTPRQVLRVAGHRLPARYRDALARYRYGMGVFKLDWALDGPIPWRAPACALAGTVHLGGPMDEVAASEAAAWSGAARQSTFVLLTQPSVFDPSRSPKDRHTAWAYCHVPHGSPGDMTETIERQVERFAPGFRDRILARHAMGPAALERSNPNLVGGDIGGGVQDLRQAFFRPTLGTYRTPLRGVFLCSASTPPGGGVHGMCGFHAARLALGRA